MLQAGLDAGLGRQLQVLRQELLLAVVLLLQTLDLTSQQFQLILVALLLGLKLRLQQPKEVEQQLREHTWKVPSSVLRGSVKL